MKTQSLMFLVGVLLCTSAFAQSGTWTREGTWKVPSEHASVVFNNKIWITGGTNERGYDYESIRCSTDGTNWTNAGQAPWGARVGHTLAVLNGRIWLMGGRDANYVRQNDVWSSADGVNWTQETAAAAWTPRMDHASVVFNNRLWVIGGFASGGGGGDAWSSADGINWTLETNAVGWGSKSTHSAVAFNGKIWVTGGDNDSAEVWSSPDGIAWTLETSTPGWAGRENHTSVVLNGEMLVIGGYSDSIDEVKNDVWSSTDGLNWTAKTTQAGWGGRRGHTSVVLGGSVYVIGGSYIVLQTSQLTVFAVCDNDWASSDAVNWTQAGGNTSWIGRHDFRAVEFRSRMWVVGGSVRHASGVSNLMNNEVWSSANGRDWRFETIAPFGGRTNFALASFNGKLWVIGGYGVDADNGEGTCNDIWSTVDGINWTLETASAAFSRREAVTAVEFNNRLWLVGGLSDFGILYNELWSSADGVNWTLETNTAAWGVLERRNYAVTVYNNRMWVAGGWGNNAGIRTEVWSSADGINWVLEQANAPNLPKQSFTLTAYDNRMWAIGGFAPVSWTFLQFPTTEVWSSTDGVNWTQWTGNIPWSERGRHEALVFKGKLWLLGGIGEEASHDDVWSFEVDSPPSITSTAPTQASVGSVYTYDITTNGSPTPTLSISGQPAWLTLNGNTLSGTPAVTDIGTTATITITATNAAGTDDQLFQIDVSHSPVITSTPPATATVGMPWTYQIVAGGTPTPTITATGLPGWLTLSGSTLAGVPGVGDLGLSGNIDITATNSAGVAYQSFQISVIGVAPQITSSPVLTVVESTPYSYTVTATGMPLPTLSASTLPAWLSFDPATGILSGTPAMSDVGTTSLITITASNNWGPNANQTFSIEVQPPFTVGGGGSSGGGAGCSSGTGNHAPALLGLLGLVALAYRRRKSTQRR
ncbi:MAG: putative Ig domain-containing protein [Planctomycetes bacterium]|nr:putative Ig domain-containing protein [Planctomycetota bacterium]